MNLPGALGLEPWLWWPLLAALGALVALDEHSLVQSWLNQPLPAAVLAGLLAGSPLAGLWLGLVVQLAIIGNIPVGASFRTDTGSATVGVAAGAVLAGWQAPPRLLDAAGWHGSFAATLGGLLVLVMLWSLAGGQLVHVERRARLGWMLAGYRSVRDGDLRRLERLHARCLGVTALRGAVLATCGALIALLVWPLLVDQALPRWLRAGLTLLPPLVPALAAGSVLERFGLRRSWRLVAVGAGAGAAFVVLVG